MEFPQSLRVFLPIFVNDPIFFIILVQARGEKRSILDILTWSLSSLGGRIGRKNLRLTSPRFPFPNRLQTHLSAALDWPSLRCTKSPTGGRGCRVSAIWKQGGMCCPARLLFKGIGLLSSRSLLVAADITSFRRRVGSVPVCWGAGEAGGFSKLNIHLVF